jgi:hypothetical protein
LKDFFLALYLVENGVDGLDNSEYTVACGRVTKETFGFYTCPTHIHGHGSWVNNDFVKQFAQMDQTAQK